MKYIITSLFLVALGFSLFSYSSKINAQTSTAYLSGYAWSSNIGWIQFESKNIKVNTDGTIVGYAWSSNIGWLQFGGLSGAPTGGGTTHANAKLQNGKITGWAKFLSANGTASGWDGWVSLDGSTYSIALNSSTNKLSGYAWGDDVVGWIDFSGVTLENDICSNGAENWPTCNLCSDGNVPVNGSCTQIDICLNIDGNQTTAPNGTIQTAGNQCSCANDAIDPPSCTTCPVGKTLNSLNQCVTPIDDTNNCAVGDPDCTPPSSCTGPGCAPSGAGTSATGTFSFNPRFASTVDKTCPLYLNISNTKGCTMTSRNGDVTDIINTSDTIIQSSGLVRYDIGTYILSCTGTDDIVLQMGSLSCYSNPSISEN